MIKLFLLIIFLTVNAHSLKADTPAQDQEIMDGLDNVKNPFDDGLPKPVPVVVQQPIAPVEPKPAFVPRPKPRPAKKPEVILPKLMLQGVIVSEDVHEAIINDKVVSLLGIIEGARVESVTKEGVLLNYMHKKFFLKVE